MLGGAAKGTFARLDTPDEAEFERYYTPLRDMLRAPVLDFNFAFDGIDLDVEEPLSLTGIIRLIDRLKADFSAQFIITLAPVAAAMQGKEHLSGFDYEVLEMMRGESVEWYNVQFYNGWGGLEDFGGVDEVLGRGWGMGRVVVGVLTGEGLGGGCECFRGFCFLGFFVFWEGGNWWECCRNVVGAVIIGYGDVCCILVSMLESMMLIEFLQMWSGRSCRKR